MFRFSVRWTGGFLGLLLAVVIGGATPLAAQQLQLKRSDPTPDPFTCPTIAAPAIPTAEERLQANELGSLAAEAMLVGDRSRAAALLSRATGLDPSSPELAYRRARVAEDMDDQATVVTEFCRFLDIGSDPEAIADARARLTTVTGAGPDEIPTEAIEKYREGLRFAEQGLLQDAVESFGMAIARRPVWADAYYNSAVVWMQLGEREQAEQDLRRYLALRPDAPDAVAVARQLGRMEGLGAVEVPKPAVALTLGVLAPGLGHVYSGRVLGGFTTLFLTGSAVGVGLLATEVDRTCLRTLPDGSCANQQETVRRPYLTPGIAAAAVISLAGAVEAFLKARRRRSATDIVAAARDGEGPRLIGPSVSSRGSQADLTLVGLSFD